MYSSNPILIFGIVPCSFFPTIFLEIAVYKEHAKSRGIVRIQLKRSRAARTRFTSKDELAVWMNNSEVSLWTFKISHIIRHYPYKKIIL